MEQENVLDKTIGKFSAKADTIQAIIIALIALLVPTFLAQLIQIIFGEGSLIADKSQLIVGSVVNTALIVAAINIKGWKKIVGIITMPSISTVLSGYVFGSASTYMVYMIPAIWIGNFALIFAYKFLMLEKGLNYFVAGIVGVFVKVLIIFGFFEFLTLFNVFPEAMISTFQLAMGAVQAITATIGVLISFVIYEIEKRKIKNN